MKEYQNKPGTSKLPAPPTLADSDLRGEPFPHDLLIQLAGEAFGLTESQTIAKAVSIGWVRVDGGWKIGH